MAQSELNIMTAGHVDHGKSTLVLALTGQWTSRHSEELKRGITIKLGYADAAFYKCEKCSGAQAYSTALKCVSCGGEAKLLRRISFVDAPGHETLMATVIAASRLVDGALFVIAANEKCPQPQTLEHLLVLEAAGIKHVVVAQNKVDLVSREQALENYAQIKEFLKGTLYENSPVIPTAANSRLNLDALIQAIQENIPTPKREEGELLMYVARSFDVNKPGTKVSEVVGGVLGGSIVKGRLKTGDEIELLPGVLKQKKEKETYTPIKTIVTSLSAGGEKLSEALSGGLIGVGTLLDPSLTRADALVGCIVGTPGKLPPLLSEILVEVNPIQRTESSFHPSIAQNEPLVLGVGTTTTVGFLKERKKKILQLILKKPICASAEEKIAVMRRTGGRWHLYGTAKLVK